MVTESEMDRYSRRTYEVKERENREGRGEGMKGKGRKEFGCRAGCE